MPEEYRKFDAADYVSTEKDARELLRAATDEDPGDGSVIRAALKHVARTRNMSALARDAGFQIEERLFTRHDLYIADECFLTGTAAEVIPVVKLDQRIIGNGHPGKVTQKLTAAFQQLTNSVGTPIYPEDA